MRKLHYKYVKQCDLLRSLLRSKQKCTTKFTVEEKIILNSKLYDGRPKNGRDTFLQGLMEV